MAVAILAMFDDFVTAVLGIQRRLLSPHSAYVINYPAHAANLPLVPL